MQQTTAIGLTQIVAKDRSQSSGCADLVAQYDDLVSNKRLDWTTNLQIRKTLGSGGQGTVYLAIRTGSDNFTMPRAVKVFSPEQYSSPAAYDADMSRMGRVAAQVATIQDDHLLAVDHFFNRDRIRIMVMEWIEGFDLRRLLTARMYGVTKERVSRKRWEELNRNLVTAGPVQPRLRPAAAISLARDCLKGLAALHSEQIVHGDVKPANIMVKRSGRAKIIDIGSAMDADGEQQCRACTPAYASPEVLKGAKPTEASDLVSLGYMAIELLTGRCLFDSAGDFDKLIAQKRALPNVLEELLLDSLETGVVGDNAENTNGQSTHQLVELCAALLAAESEPEDSTKRLLAQMEEQFLSVDLSSHFRIWIEELLELE